MGVRCEQIPEPHFGFSNERVRRRGVFIPDLDFRLFPSYRVTGHSKFQLIAFPLALRPRAIALPGLGTPAGKLDLEVWVLFCSN